MQDKSTQRRQLGCRVADLAWELAVSIAHAIELREEPPAAVIMAERDLWRWAEQLRRAVPHPTENGIGVRRVAVVLLVEITGNRDAGWVGQELMRAAGLSGDCWQVRHHTVHTDPTEIYRHRPRGMTGGGRPMITVSEAFVATQLGVLRVWATSEHILRAATLVARQRRW
jgi:hypothetical protein